MNTQIPTTAPSLSYIKEHFQTHSICCNNNNKPSNTQIISTAAAAAYISHLYKMSLLPRFGFGQDLFDSLLEDFFHVPSLPSDSRTENQPRLWRPRLDVSETDKQYTLTCELPGLTKEHIKIDIDDEHKHLTISGKREEVKKEEGEKYHLVERCYGDFKRRLALPRDVHVDGIKARMENGVLHLALPKREVPPARTLTIE